MPSGAKGNNILLCTSFRHAPSDNIGYDVSWLNPREEEL